MKKITLLFVMVGCFAFVTKAQEKGQIRAGAGLVLGTKAAFDAGGDKAGVGINIGGEYFVSEIISIAPSYTFFLKSDLEIAGVSTSLKTSSFNIDGRYYFMTGSLQVYGLAGLSFATAKSETSGDIFGVPFSQTFKSNDTGLNIGGGIVLPLNDQLSFNGQIKYNTPFEQLVLGAGIVFSL